MAIQEAKPKGHHNIFFFVVFTITFLLCSAILGCTLGLWVQLNQENIHD